MGLGDNLIGSGLACGAHARGKRIAFGDGQRIIWDHHSPEIFRGNPNIAAPGSERDKDIEWIAFHRHNRIYNRHDVKGHRWVWNYDFRPTPGELFFTGEELAFSRGAGTGFVLIEPNVPDKIGAPNKRWPVERYEKLASDLWRSGHDVVQFSFGAHRLSHARQIKAPSFRHAAAILANAKLFIGAEGGLHHAAAAVGIPAVVLFGAWIPPQVTGYDTHTNIASGEACGSLSPCPHCKEAMDAITVEQVYESAKGYLTQ